jgi:hypothetical protein
MAVLEFMPSQSRIIRICSNSKGRIQCPFFNSDIAFSQGTFQLVNAPISTFCNKNPRKARANKIWAIAWILTRSRQSQKENQLFFWHFMEKRRVVASMLRNLPEEIGKIMGSWVRVRHDDF